MSGVHRLQVIPEIRFRQFCDAHGEKVDRIGASCE